MMKEVDEHHLGWLLVQLAMKGFGSTAMMNPFYSYAVFLPPFGATFVNVKIYIIVTVV